MKAIISEKKLQVFVLFVTKLKLIQIFYNNIMSIEFIFAFLKLIDY